MSVTSVKLEKTKGRRSAQHLVRNEPVCASAASKGTCFWGHAKELDVSEFVFFRVLFDSDFVFFLG